jgi:multidrug efflux pump subunit AcrB
MAKGANILAFGKEVGAATDTFMEAVPQGIAVEQIADQPAVVDHAIWEFEKSFLEALGIVLLVSFLSLGLRTGIVVALSVPLVLGITFIAMMILGIDLHRITLGALIIALGLLVDDAIIAAEMMVVKMEEGFDRARAAAFAWTSTAFPMLTGTLVTAAGFLPVGFANSSVGEYAGGIFWVVAIALVASWFVAVIFTPYLGVKLLPERLGRHAGVEPPSSSGERSATRGPHSGEAADGEGRQRPGGPRLSLRSAEDDDGVGALRPHDIYDTRLYRALRGVIRACVKFRLATVLATVGIFVAAIVAFGNVPQQFFPLSKRPELFFQMRLPEGTAIGVTAETAAKAERLLGDDPDIATHTTYVGQGSPRFWLGLNPQLPNEAFAEIVIVAKDVDARERIKTRVEAAVAAGALSEARVRVDRFNFGPPVGFPVQFRVIGPEPMAVREIAGRVREAMRANPDVVDPHLDWNEMTPSVRLVVDQERARALGLDPQAISQTLQTLLSGRPITVVRDGTERVEVIARAVKDERLDLGRIGDLTLTSRNGVPVPLAQVGHVTYGHEEPILWRRNRDMAITVRADVVDGVQPPDVTNAIWPTLEGIRNGLAPGYRLEIGGAVEESEKGNASLFALFPVMALAMLTLLMIQLQSFSRLILVFLTAPLGIIGASLALNLSGKPFGFVALLGLIALAGMIMRNAVILVDQIETDVDGGLSLREAIVEATVRRARPVVLTALAAILAMWPLSSSAFWGPMAFTIMGGLFVATFLTLLFLPALYALWFRKRLDERGAAVAEDEDAVRLEPRPALPMAAE